MVPDLDEISTPWRLTVYLNTLKPPDGARLLSSYEVNGIMEELKRASEQVDGNALALILLGTYLRGLVRGDVRRRDTALLFAGAERYAEHAHKVIKSYETWFEAEDEVGPAAIAILRLMGLFNRPADAGCLAALRAEPAIPDLTKPLFEGGRQKMWQRAVQRLRRAHLLAAAAPSYSRDQFQDMESLDCHPLIREYFAEALKTSFPDAWRAGHSRIFHHLCNRWEMAKSNWTVMKDLFYAVSHGCMAGEHNEALLVFRTRIREGGQKNVSVWEFAAYADDLATLKLFLGQPLNQSSQAYVLNEVGADLRALGQYSEARGTLRMPSAFKKGFVATLGTTPLTSSAWPITSETRRTCCWLQVRYRMQKVQRRRDLRPLASRLRSRLLTRTAGYENRSKKSADGAHWDIFCIRWGG